MTKKNYTAIIGAMAMVVITAIWLSSCQKSNPTLGALPSPSFKAMPLTPTSDAEAQNIELINTTSTPGIAYWNIPGVGSFKGDTVKATIVFAGDYPVHLIIAGQGGIDSVTQSVNIAQDNIYAVGPTTLLGVLTGAGIGKTERTWMPTRVTATVSLFDNYNDVLASIEAGGGGAWYYFGQYGELNTDGTGRDAYFDDKSTFLFNKAGDFVYDDNNTIYCDGTGSPWTRALNPNLPAGNYTSSDFFVSYPQDKAWGSGNFTYTINPAPAGAMQLGTITLHGAGAHLGLPDKSNTIEQVTPDLTSATYDILKVSLNQSDAGGTYDEIIFGIFVANTTNNYWGFRYKSYR